MIIGLGVVGVALLHVGEEIRASRGEGSMGAFVARELDCSGRGPCEWRGKFTSDDGAIVKHDVWLHGRSADELSPDAQTPALLAGTSGNVYAPGTSQLFLTIFLLPLVGMVLAVMGVAFLFPRALQRFLRYATRPITRAIAARRG
ncbi:hypothetical protein [Nonomuraea endophytica]|uniref:DUF3592 domain-containing protein n=1 Tax=Nonomuraea endophytica TaxID=714136 RepID=A0A7W8AD85_9ACTN|nr:hypothetical protein [Nonomuraea endophytica]MBB5083968.1 hypothetical protein [Nonomuraea endophytica]